MFGSCGLSVFFVDLLSQRCRWLSRCRGMYCVKQVPQQNTTTWYMYFNHWVGIWVSHEFVSKTHELTRLYKDLGPIVWPFKPYYLTQRKYFFWVIINPFNTDSLWLIILLTWVSGPSLVSSQNRAYLYYFWIFSHAIFCYPQ